MVEIGADGFKSVDYSKLTPILVEAIKELNAELQQQEIENSQLNLKVKSLENENATMRADIDTIKTLIGMGQGDMKQN